MSVAAPPETEVLSVDSSEGSRGRAVRGFFRDLLRDKAAFVGFVVLVLLVLMAVLAPLLAPYDPAQQFDPAYAACS